jgi:hypothetical protein
MRAGQHRGMSEAIFLFFLSFLMSYLVAFEDCDFERNSMTAELRNKETAAGKH